MSLALDPPRSKAILPLSLAIIGLFVAGLVGTFAVGDGGKGNDTALVVGGDVAQLVPAAAETTAKAGTAKFELTIAAALAQGAKVNTTSTGAFDFAARTATMDQRTTLPGAFGSVESTVLFDGASVYLGGATVATKLPDGKKFVKVPVPSDGSLPSTTSTPADLMATLRTVSSEVREVGHENVRGAGTTHYRFTVDGEKAFPGSGRGVSLPADVWLDNGGKLRRMQLTLDIGKVIGAMGAAGANGTMTLNLELYDFGTEVNVAAPPADQVVDGSSVGLTGLGSAFSGFGGP